MSVLVESCAIVVPCSSLNAFWPGGTAAFLSCMRASFPDVRYMSVDNHLASISLETDDTAEPLTAQLRAYGLIEVMDGEFHDFALVDEISGLTLPCEWLHLAEQTDGYLVAWLAGTERGELAIPENWNPADTRRRATAESARIAP